MSAPLAIDLYCGLGGWTEGLLAEGYYVVGFDIERHQYGEQKYPGHLVIQDVLTLHGKQFKDAALIVGSSPCQEFSYRAMPWKRAKALGPPELGMALFNAQFRIQREACEAAGRHIPLVVENVRGAIPWVGRSRWNYGSYHLWGDVPALMPMTLRIAKRPGHDWNRFNQTGEVSPHWRLDGQDSRKATGGSWFSIEGGKENAGRNDPPDDVKVVAHLNKHGGHRSTSHLTNPAEHLKNSGGSWFAVSHNKVPMSRGDEIKCGGDWFGPGEDSGAMRNHHSKSTKRKAASAMIAKIPLPLAQHIARVYHPER